MPGGGFSLSVRPRGSVAMSPHALERFGQRVCPALDRAGAEQRLRSVWPSHTVVEAAPPWLLSEQEADFWVMLGADVAMPVRRRVVVTVLTPEPSELALEARRVRRAERAEARARGRRERPSRRRAASG